jgi:hypothetical protein
MGAGYALAFRESYWPEGQKRFTVTMDSDLSFGAGGTTAARHKSCGESALPAMARNWFLTLRARILEPTRSKPIAVAKSGAEGGGSEESLRNRFRGTERDSSDGQKRDAGPPLISGGGLL